ncbi:MAG: flagellar biosynthesis anti-sigma factor FlgM, partial [Clostridia bacterium]|nr:flagellar biosynthesis anti-sigma factor FlgM [Clostridia bacterium]
GISSPLQVTRPYYTEPRRGAQQAAAAGQKYDSVDITSHPAGESRFLDMVSRLTQEVRAATTTGDIGTLRRQIEAGEYKVDAASIAARMLPLEEGLW